MWFAFIYVVMVGFAFVVLFSAVAVAIISLLLHSFHNTLAHTHFLFLRDIRMNVTRTVFYSLLQSLYFGVTDHFSVKP